MPVRIYALAKKLNLDNKVLVDICKKAGITGKGSALASLSDEELAKVNAYMGAAEAKVKVVPTAKKGKEPEAKAIRREDYMAPGGGAASGKVRVLDVKKDKLKAKAPTPEEPPEEEEPPVQKKPAAKLEPKPTEPKPTEPKPTEPKPTEPKPTEPKPTEPKQERPTGPTLRERPIRLRRKKPLDLKPGEKRRPSKASEKTAPAIKLAPMPIAKTPAGKPKSKEPTPQKPDIKLPPDAIRAASKSGTKPLSEHLRKHEKKKKAAQKTPHTKGGAPGPKTPTETSVRPQRSRRGTRAGAAEKDPNAPVLGGREARQLKRKKSGANRRRRGGDDDDRRVNRRRMRIRRTGANTAAPRKGNIPICVPCSVREFSEAVGIAAKTILGKLLELGTMSNIAANLEYDMVELLSVELGVEVDLQETPIMEERLLAELQVEDDPATLQPRPPVVTFLGHVDHGKTSLLDRIINTDVVSGEKGGITQHIRAYRVEKDGRAVAFVDTPGHEAFTEMRARGANVTDIAVLVVAADDGVMPQTEEAISHARAAGVPIVVALNKIDLPGASEQKAYEQLAANELLPTEWGGDTDVIKTSAITGEGIDELLETLLTIAELHEYKANPDRQGVGTCLEAELHEGRGVIAKLLVQKGTMHVGDVVVCGAAYGRVKAMYDTLIPHQKHESAPPSTPVNVTGLNIAPNAGDQFFVIEDVSQARALAEQRGIEARQQELGSRRKSHVTLENLVEHLDQQEVQTLGMILRADVQGSIEAIRKELTKLDHPEIEIKILQATIGGITEADVHLADASDAVIIGFNVVPDEGARQLADSRAVQIRRYDIIYQITEDLRAAMEGMLKPEQQEKELGRALVKQTFRISRLGTIAGCQVLSGTVERDARTRIIRESRVIGDYQVDSLRREKDDVREVRNGFECGLRLKGFNDLKEGDVLEVYRIEEIRRTLEL